MSRLFYNVIGALFRLGLKAYYRLEIRGIENYSESPSTLIVANHKRDMDSILLATVFYFQDGFLRPGREISFMGSENLFQPGFLATWINGPKFLQKLLAPISLNYILRSLNAHPIGKLDFDSLPLHDALQVIEKHDGDRRLSEVIDDELAAELVRSSGHRSSDPRISRYLNTEGYPRKKIDVQDLKKSYRKVVKRNKLGSVKQQLGEFIDLLNQGQILYITPEGQLSSNGLLGPLKDSMLILIDETDPVITITPTNITYDFLTEGKGTVFVNVGSEMEHLSEMGREGKSELIRESILSLTTVTMSQLGSRQLVKATDEDKLSVKEDELWQGVLRDLNRLREQDIWIDTRLTKVEGREECWEKFLKYCEREDIIRYQSRGTVDIDGNLGRSKGVKDRLGLNRKIGYRRDPLRYCANELRALSQIDLIELD